MKARAGKPVFTDKAASLQAFTVSVKVVYSIIRELSWKHQEMVVSGEGLLSIRLIVQACVCTLMPPALPSEVIDNVQDFLQDDISSLCAASLVCHSFLPCARYHVFSSLSLNINNVHSLVHLLSSPTCTIPTACNVMEISVGPLMNAAWTADIIERLQQHFTTVRQSLSVYEVVDEAIMKAILGGNGFRGPRILALFDCLIRGCGEFEVLISNRCKGVEKLVLSDVIWIPVGHLEEPETWAPEKMENTSTLKSLEMRSVSITPILDQISFHPFIHSLESFSAVFLTERHLASVQTFLHCSAATLKSCEIGYNLDYSRFCPLSVISRRELNVS